MLVLEGEAIEFERRRRTVFEACDHRLPAARIAADSVDGEGIVRRQNSGVRKGAGERDRACWIAARIGDFPRRPYLVGLIRRELRKTVGPVARDAKGRRCVQHLGCRGAHAVDQRNGLSRGFIRQAEDDEIHLPHQRTLGACVLAPLLGNAFHHDVVLLAKALLNAEACRSGCAIDKDGGLRGVANRPRLMGVGYGHGTLLSSRLVSLAKACGLASLISCAICWGPASVCDESAPATAA